MARNDDLNLGKGAQVEAPVKGGGKGKLIAIVVAVVLLLGGAAGAWVMLAGNDEVELADGTPSPSKAEQREPVYMPMEKFLVNFDHKGGMRYIQTDIQLMAFDARVLEHAERNMPAVRNRLIMLFSDQDFDALRTVQGKESLRQEVLLAVNDVLKASGPDAVQEVFFTSFVLQ